MSAAKQRIGSVTVSEVDAPPPDGRRGNGGTPTSVPWSQIAGYLRGFPRRWFRLRGDQPLQPYGMTYMKRYGCEAVWRDGEVYARFGGDS